MNSKMFMWCCFCVFVMATYQVLCEDIIMSCPAKWYEGQTVTLSCAVNSVQWQHPSPCIYAYSETVEFKFKKNAQTQETTERTMSNVKTTCSSTPTSDGCWCSLNGTYYLLYCNVTANKTTYDGGSWKCQPECSGSGTVMTSLLTRECTYTTFYDVCEGNPCSPGNCSVVNNQRSCSCSGTLYSGETCKDILCGKNSTEKCCLNHITTNGANDWTKVTCLVDLSSEVSFLKASHQEDIKTTKFDYGFGFGFGFGLFAGIIIGFFLGMLFCCSCYKRKISLETADANEVEKILNTIGFDKYAKITNTSVIVTHKNFWNSIFIATAVRDIIKNIQKNPSSRTKKDGRGRREKGDRTGKKSTQESAPENGNSPRIPSQQEENTLLRQNQISPLFDKIGTPTLKDNRTLPLPAITPKS